jgi:hypothetical protein
MSPSEFFQLHPQEFWWLVEAWNNQDDHRPGRTGLSKKDIQSMKSTLKAAKEKHARGEWLNG